MMRFVAAGPGRSLALCALVAAAACGGSGGTYDLILEGGTVVDGTGADRRVADVAIREGRIAKVGDASGDEAARRIDARGLVVAPGFIDPHTHTRGHIRDMPAVRPFLFQGVTTLVEGNDGSSPVPLGPFLDSVAAARPSPNFAMFIGHGSVRQRVMGTANRAPTAQELDSMKALVSQGMEQGALGLSTGLAYVPGTYATTEEVIELAKVAAAHGGIYISHMRDEGAGVLESVRETIRIGEEAGIPVQMTHHKVGGHRQWGQSEESIRLMREARARGVDVTFDQYPYTASSTGFSFLIPKWAMSGDSLQVRLAVPATRARIMADMLDFIDERFGNDPERIQLVTCGFDPSLGGRTVGSILRDRGKAGTATDIAELSLEFDAAGGCGAILHSYDEGDVVRFLQSEYGMVGSDGSLVPMGEGFPHPRAYGTYPRVLGRYVREMGVITLEEAVRRMTSAPARRLGFGDRGELQEGWVADVAVFDPEEVSDRATFEDPHQYAVGMKYVLVGGELVLDDGAYTGARPGRILFGPGRRAP
ncbi:MAG TPA: D-aminoacylase [Longimicrobiales bacterium]|nr:D-aminoacylase [Longimicrobiales bacterium]